MTLDPVRLAALESTFRDIAATRMAGVPVLHPKLAVQAVDFRVTEDPARPDELLALGVLVTPWFMNLVRLPLDAAAAAAMPGVGRKRQAVLAGQAFEFIGAQENALGPFEGCSLFSPMFEFADQAGAVATAEAVLAHLRPPVTARPVERAEPVPARRSFLLGRSAVGAPGAAR